MGRTAAVNLIDTLYYTVLEYNEVDKKYKVKIKDESGRIVSISAWESKAFLESACSIDTLKTIDNIMGVRK